MPCGALVAAGGGAPCVLGWGEADCGVSACTVAATMVATPSPEGTLGPLTLQARTTAVMARANETIRTLCICPLERGAGRFTLWSHPGTGAAILGAILPSPRLSGLKWTGRARPTRRER